MFQQVKYKNGLTSVISPLAGTKAVTVLVAVRVGSRYETDRTNGLAHFTEHMMFKGTTRRPSTLKISRELDSIGADYNAFTGKEYTCYYIKTDAQYLVLALDILADMLQYSLFAKKEIEREKGVIIEEINMYEDAPMMILEDVFDESAFPQSQLGKNIAGSKDTVSAFKKEDFIKFFHRYYTAKNMLVVVAGHIDQPSVTRQVEKFFGQIKPGKKGNFKKNIIRQNKAKVFLKEKPTEQIHMALGFVGDIKHNSIHTLPLKIANVAFGGNMSSRLFINIREREGLGYYIRSQVNSFADNGTWAVYAGLDKDRLLQAVSLITKEFVSLKKRGLSSVEFDKAKNYIHGKSILAFEDSSRIAQWYADRWLDNLPLETPLQYLAKVKDVKLSSARSAWQRIIDSHRLNLAVVGGGLSKENLFKLINF